MTKSSQGSVKAAVSSDTELLGRREREVRRRGRELWEQARAGREEFFRTVLESLAEGLVITDEESRVVYANGRFCDITGYTKDELVGKTSYELLLAPEEWPQQRRRLSERLSGKCEMYEHELLQKGGGRRWVQVMATPYLDAQGRIVGTIGALVCIEKTKALERENEWLLDEVRSQSNFGSIIGRSDALKKVLEQIRVVAPTPAGVLILGESGTGKELVARAIHENSARRDKPLVRVNCASIPKDLFESEFFGHVKGAFTGAVKDRTGRFELAHGGTLFLDEVGEIPLDLQAKLLRVLQEGQFEKVGEEKTRTVDIRLIAATNRDLHAEARAGHFRQDLYFRLSVFPIELPPLRERREDIAPLAEFFLQQSAQRLGARAPRLFPAQLRQLESYDWPGNVRELQNVIERAMILQASKGRLEFALSRDSLAAGRKAAAPAPEVDGQALTDLKRQEREVIARALEQTGGKIYGPDGAAALLGMRPTTLASRIQRYGLRK